MVNALHVTLELTVRLVSELLLFEILVKIQDLLCALTDSGLTVTVKSD
jgi:hypothetical protein